MQIMRNRQNFQLENAEEAEYAENVEYAKYAEYAEYAGYAEYTEYAKYAEYFPVVSLVKRTKIQDLRIRIKYQLADLSRPFGLVISSIVRDFAANVSPLCWFSGAACRKRACGQQEQ